MGQVQGAGGPGIAKGWIQFNGKNNVILDSFNVSSITDFGAGQYGVNWDIDFSSINYCTTIGTSYENGVQFAAWGVLASSADALVGSVQIQVRNSSGTLVDSDNLNMAAFGDQ